MRTQGRFDHLSEVTAAQMYNMAAYEYCPDAKDHRQRRPDAACILSNVSCFTHDSSGGRTTHSDRRPRSQCQPNASAQEDVLIDTHDLREYHHVFHSWKA
jgi:hypothetical protein